MQNISEILSTYSADLAEVQEVINSRLHSYAESLSTISRYLSNLGGKKVRPLLAISLARGLGLNSENEKNEQLYTLSAGIEMIHMATLLHDDIIDKSLVRRHQPSAFSKYGMEDTLLTGDFLLVRAFGLCSRLDKPLIYATEEACVALTEGEILEKRISTHPASIEKSIVIAHKKTAALFELASFSAAYLAGMSEEMQKTASELGRTLGIGFQIVDDILDVISDDSVLGKPSGQDLREQKPSIINLLWIADGSENSKGLLDGNENPSEEWVQASLKEIKGSDIPDKARKLATEYFTLAKQQLDILEKAAEAAEKKIHFNALKNLLDFAHSRMY